MLLLIVMSKNIGLFPGNHSRARELLKRHQELIPISFSTQTGQHENYSKILLEHSKMLKKKDQNGSTYLDILAQVHVNYQMFYRFNVGQTNYELFIRSLALEVYVMVDLLKNNNLSAVVSTTSIAHHYDSLVVELACKFLGIPQIYLYNIASTNRLLPLVQLNGIEDRRPIGVNISKCKIKRVSDLLIDRHETKVFLYRAKFKSLKQAISKVKYFLYIVSKFNKGSLFNEYVSISRDISIYFRQKKALKKLLFFSKLDAEIISTHEFYSSHFIIIFAHYQPEATTFPEGKPYFNHIDLVVAIREKGFSGNIIFKEHPAIGKHWDEALAAPTRVGLYRSSSFYQQLKSLGCKIIHTNLVEDTLSKAKSYSMITISGTIALELAAEGRQIIVAGHPWFKKMPNCLSFDEVTNFADVNSAKKSESLKDECDNYTKNICNNKTLTNGLGIASNSISTDLTTFDQEFSVLLNYLAGNSFGETKI